ncbi:MAG TPA: MFS transporter [Mycobacteriales bacterium]|nr:MFS transporter [Mycobacteriales bacterium]
MRLVQRLGSVAGDDPAAARIVTALIVAVFVQGVGASAVLPLLPLYLRAHGTSNGLVGAVMGSFFVAGVLTQYGAGHLTDRIGHRPVIVGGLGLYAAASLAFLATVGSGGYVALRSLQGIGAGAVQVASLALVGLVVPAERRGRAFSAVFAAQLAGMAVGPLAGSIAGVTHLRWLFVATAALTLTAVIPVAAGAAHAGRADTTEGTEMPLSISRALVGVAIVGVATGLVTGVYEACWSLLMHSRGAADWQIGLSWTLFALPFALFSPIAGRLADRLDRRWLAAAAVVASSAFAALYPFLTSVALLVGLGAVEAIGVAVAFPAAQSLLTQAATPQTLGRAQGFFTTAETASIAVAAAVSGTLFGVARWIPFVTASLAGVAMVAVLPVLWRGLPGHADGRATVTDVPPPVPQSVPH